MNKHRQIWRKPSIRRLGAEGSALTREAPASDAGASRGREVLALIQALYDGAGFTGPAAIHRKREALEKVSAGDYAGALRAAIVGHDQSIDFTDCAKVRPGIALAKGRELLVVEAQDKSTAFYSKN